MESKYEHKLHEQRIYEKWEKSGAFKAEVDKNKKPYTILLPPPNASGKMHTGNVLMIAIEDFLIRRKRMQGYSALWVPGTDHAGIETQVTYERELKKQGKSRFDFDRQALYDNILKFVMDNRHLIEGQMRDMGASIDWSRYTFTLDPIALEITHSTFEKMEKDGLIYRDDYMVNYCPKCGTTFSDIEVIHEDRTDPLFYIRYRLVDPQGKEPKYVVVATVRPETIFVDTHLAVNPKDAKKKWMVGRKFLNPLTDKVMEVVEDSYVDPKFGGGILKVTPAHDKNDYEIGKRHNLKVIQAFDLNGRLLKNADNYAGLKVLEARKQIIEDLSAKDLIEKIDEKYSHAISVCNRSSHEIEPTILPNWFIQVDKPGKSFKKPALDAVKNGDVKIFPKWREITYVRWMEEMRDWPISRQNVFGIRIPAWYAVEENPELQVTFLAKEGTVTDIISELLKKHSFEEIEKGMQSMIVPRDAKYIISKTKPAGGGKNYLQDTNTFDTWFSSGQWPLTTLKYPDSEDFKYFYPTSVLETGWEIIRLWVSRMVMFGIYLTDKPPFEHVYLHGMVRALDGRKMSKSLGNVINPDEYLTEYGADALRMGLISGTAMGRDFSFPRDKIISYRNFANKIWNMGRFMLMLLEQESLKMGDILVAEPFSKEFTKSLSKEDSEILKSLAKLIKSIDKKIEKYRFADAAEEIYQFVWHELADNYLEYVKGEGVNKKISLSVFRHVYSSCLKLLHPFMPFVTEAIWENIKSENERDLIISEWPGVR